MKRWLLLGLLLTGCNIINKPCSPPCGPNQACVAGVCLSPTPTPPVCPATCPAGTQCTDPAKGCEQIPPPGPVCQEGQFCNCWHNPTGAEWLEAKCPEGQECTIDKKCVTPVPPPPKTCEPPCKADEKCVERGSVEKIYECVKIPGPNEPALIPDEELTGVPDSGGVQMWDETSAAIERWKTLHPEKWNHDKTCLVSVSGIDDAFLGIATELARQLITAGQSITKSGKRSDAIFVNRTGTNLYEEMHVFEYGRACAATGPNAYKGLYKRAVPPTSDTCPFPPCPLKTYPDGTPHWKFNAKPHTMQNCDSTPVETKNCAYCKSIGMGEISPGVPRCDCPVRPDGHPERPPVEAWLLDGGAVHDSRNGQDCTPNNTTNPMAFLCGTGNCRNCNATKTVCTAWF